MCHEAGVDEALLALDHAAAINIRNKASAIRLEYFAINSNGGDNKD